jgi:beta-lactamase class A
MKPVACLLTFVLCTAAGAQTPLQSRLQTIAAEAQGTVSMACAYVGVPPAVTAPIAGCAINLHGHPPMQSVFKLPLSMAVMHVLVETGRLTLDSPVRFEPRDRILPHTYSPLQDKYPSAGVAVPLRELLRLAISMSDNAASEVLLRIVGGPQVVDKYIASLNVGGFQLRDGEGAMTADERLQYRNWWEPSSAIAVLAKLDTGKALNAADTAAVLGWMRETTTGPNRIKAGLPAGTVWRHKTGSSGIEAGVAAATNDIGLFPLPDGRVVALAIFVSDSHAGDATREAAIAHLAQAVYEAAASQADRPETK